LTNIKQCRQRSKKFTDQKFFRQRKI